MNYSAQVKQKLLSIIEEMDSKVSVCLLYKFISLNAFGYRKTANKHFAYSL